VSGSLVSRSAQAQRVYNDVARVCAHGWQVM